ncbi:glycosyl-transferase for dystroglycan-domain-containing protein [Cantharellus anzutake]|uniref:glycosyl-transferase for dystroglycan-domain-containing protein n=1 Tax=Cantharellus anzutake TaxID=1750568 RepID=UPI001902E08E|nr:glycosyl-transferase for dystroglycan-domain-containing protein [Cantharellus anzutake]KAF8336462.1 glycosyl-transferase for dystroglycan-domain-containing protein [Cantharellus anzutake]
MLSILREHPILTWMKALYVVVSLPLLLAGRVVPYYYRASHRFPAEDITITTLVTGNRFHILSDLAQSYHGPISVAVHVSSGPRSEVSSLLDSLHSLYETIPAILHARTDYVMMLDVDFSICTDFRSRILESQDVISKLRMGDVALVVPAFEFTDQRDGIDPSTFPKDKEGLLSLVQNGKLNMFHASWLPGHHSTNYDKYYEAPAGHVYRVTDYQYSYEPYIIFKRDSAPWCDERFVGYGSNKAACLFGMYLSGISFYVLPDDFVIHRSHIYAEKTRTYERKYNSLVYADFRAETCLRYFMQRLLDGTLELQKGENVRTECIHIDGVPGAVKEVSA